jgi:hypothetical protein
MVIALSFTQWGGLFHHLSVVIWPNRLHGTRGMNLIEFRPMYGVHY